MKKSLLLVALFALQTLACSAFEGGLLRGLVTTPDNNPQPFATVLLKSAVDSSLYKGEITDDKGIFLFENVKDGNYYLQIQVVGFEKKTVSPILISSADPTVDLGTIQLAAAAKELSAVNVLADKPFIEQQVDKTVVNVENSIIQNGSSIMEVMEKLPGVIVDQNDRISLRGKQGVIIMIDGRPTGMTGQDLANMLKGTPSANIQKIELITNPSAKYDAAGNAGIINIIMKKNKREGFNGSVSAGYGQGRYSKYNGSVNLNYKNKNYNLFLNYSYAHRLGFNNLTIDRKFYGGDTINTIFRTENYILFPSENHTPRVGIDFYLSPKTTLSLLGSGGQTLFSPQGLDHTNILNGKEQILRSYDFESHSKDNWYNYSGNAELRHQFDSTGQELTVDLDYARYWNATDESFLTTYHNSDGSFLSRDDLHNDQKSNLYLYSVKADYTKPLKKEYSFDAGLKSSYVASDNDISGYDVLNNEEIYDSARSSHFLYSENINAAYVNLKKNYKKFSYQLGLRSEQTIAKGKQLMNSRTFDRNYIQVFPTAFFDFKPSEKQDINISLGRRIDRPAYEQMNPYRSLINATTYSEGNPYLLPQLTYNTELSYSYNNAFFISLAYSFTTDNITDVLIQDSQTQTTSQTVVNLNQLNFYSVNLTYSKKLTKWWTTNSSILSYYGVYSGTINHSTINQGTPSFYLNTSNSIFITDGLSAEISFRYNYKALNGITTDLTTYNLTAGIQKTVLHKKGTITVNMSDILWKAYPSGITELDHVREDWTAKRDTRVLNVSFAYKFGKGKSGRMRRNTGADDEKGRIKGA
ncbi:MAG: outer membrane beta-barrel protein [Bacteroidia bacterium]